MFDYGFDQWSFVSFVIKKLFVYLFMVKECTYLVIQVYFMQIYFYFLWFGNKFTDFCVFPKVLNLHTRWNTKESKILRKFKTQFEGRQFKSDYEQQTFVLYLYEVNLENPGNNVLNLSLNNVDIALANYVTEQF